MRIKEPIRVAVVFGPGHSIKPVWFDWRRRKYTVKEITYTWRERRGEATVFHFAVSDGAPVPDAVRQAPPPAPARHLNQNLRPNRQSEIPIASA